MTSFINSANNKLLTLESVAKSNDKIEILNNQLKLIANISADANHVLG